ncbi:MAG: hypothetical protein ABJB12_15485 [Pseudomonadota bacterium]
MVERQLNWRRNWIGVAALVTGALLFWVALHSDGGDWYICQTHADIMYMALSRFREWPYFSWVFNGGTYFLQDPQSNLYSPVVPLVMLFGPSMGLRIMAAIWGVLGVIAFTGFMRRRVSFEAALFASVASVLSLGVLWRVAVGNDMFLWHLGLPGILWAVDRVFKERSVRSMLTFALVLGLLLLGPTFHSFTYIFVSAVPAYVLLELFFNRPTKRVFFELVGLFAGGCVIAALMIGPKLACWAIFPMSRPTDDFGAIPLLTGLRESFDYSQAKDFVVNSTLLGGTWPHQYYRGWGVEESAVALPWVASLLAIAGMVAAAVVPSKRRIGLFAAALCVWGLTLACSVPVFETFRALTGGNFRVAPRFLGLTGFGLAVFCALGADVLFARLKQRARPVGIGLFVVMACGALWWMHRASQTPMDARTVADDVNAEAIHPIATYKEERRAAAQVNSFDTVVRFRNRRDILEGIGYTDGFFVVGNEYQPHLYPSIHPQPVVILGIKPNRVTVEHLRIKIRGMVPRSRIFLRAQKPAYGLQVVTDPPTAHVRVRQQGPFLVVENHDHSPVRRVVLRAEFPVSVLWMVVAILSLLGTVTALVVLEVSRRRASPAERSHLAQVVEV